MAEFASWEVEYPLSQQELITSTCYLTLWFRKGADNSWPSISVGFAGPNSEGQRFSLDQTLLRDSSILRFWYLQGLLGPIL